MSVLLYPCLVAQFLHGRGLRGNHVVAQAKGMSHLMAANETDELPHQFVAKLHSPGTLV